MFICLIALFAVVQVYLLNTYSTIGDTLSKLNQEIDTVEADNIRLNQQVASASSLSTITQKAKALGLVDNPKTLSLSSPLPLAESFHLPL